ncbi:MAG: hypothetical protein M0R80_08320 [Proteobacteria bacterium]|jgi:hypothetical protein|nr:hypothetical protein [Pseudomonadota bacterium]
MKIYKPLHEEIKLDAFIKQNNYKSVLVVFRHGLGDLLMFLEPFRVLKEKNPGVFFNLAIAKELGQEEVCPDALRLSDEELLSLPHEVMCKIDFQMSESQDIYTKGEWCCIHELGIEPVCGNVAPYMMITNRLVSLHFNITCLPGACNADESTASAIWQEVIEAGYIPIESHFEHIYHNPVNKKFDFVTATVRGCKPRISSLAGLIKNSCAFIGVVSGNFHTALALLPPERIMLLEKDFTAPMFTKLPITRCDIKNYQKGSVCEFLSSLKL